MHITMNQNTSNRRTQTRTQRRSHRENRHRDSTTLHRHDIANHPRAQSPGTAHANGLTEPEDDERGHLGTDRAGDREDQEEDIGSVDDEHSAVQLTEWSSD